MTIPHDMTKECQFIQSNEGTVTRASTRDTIEFVSLLKPRPFKENELARDETGYQSDLSNSTSEDSIQQKLETKTISEQNSSEISKSQGKLVTNMRSQGKSTSISNQMIIKQSKRASTTTNRSKGNQSKQLKRPQKPRRRVATLAQRRAANIRERRRMFNLNSAFDRLRKKVPSFAYEKRLSRIETLKLAIMYIKFMDDLVNDSAYAEKYKKLTANTSVAQATSGFLSSSSYLSLYGPQQCSSPTQQTLNTSCLARTSVANGQAAMSSRIADMVENSSFNNSKISLPAVSMPTEHRARDSDYNGMNQQTTSTYSKSASPIESYCSDNQCTQLGPVKAPLTCCPISPTSSTSANTCQSSLASADQATRDSTSPNASISPLGMKTKQTNDKKQPRQHSPTSNNQSPASANLFYSSANRQDQAYHPRPYSGGATQLLHQSSTTIYYGASESSIKHSSINDVGSIYYDLQPRITNGQQQQSRQDAPMQCGLQDNHYPYYGNSTQMMHQHDKETRSTFNLPGHNNNNNNNNVYNLSPTGYSEHSIQQQYNPQPLDDYQSHHHHQHLLHNNHDPQVSSRFASMPSQSVGYVPISSLQEAK